MKIIFEDGETSTISQLLLASLLGTDMRFLNGVGNIVEHLRKNADLYKDDFLLIFIDVVPDNPNTVKDYYRVCTEMLTIRGVDFKKSCYVVPIFCIEYYVLKYANWFLKLQEVTEFLTKYNTPFGLQPYDTVVSESGVLQSRGNTMKSYENRCKAVLEYLSNIHLPFEGEHKGKYPCLTDISIKNKRFNGGETACLYLEDCSSCDRPCKFALAGEQAYKANWLYVQLPVFMNTAQLEQCLKSEFKTTTWEQLVVSLRKEYDDLYGTICEKFEEAGEPCPFTNLIL